jgi:formate dehydrogenase major subunit
VIKLTIDSKQVEVPEGTTVLRAAEQAGIFIPTLCDHPELTPYGGCRLCVVELDGARGPVTSCTMPVTNGMVVRTDTPKLHDIRKFVLMLLFSERNHYCMYCQKSGGDCALQNAAYGEGMTHWPIQPNWQTFVVDSSHPNFVLDNNRCILCRRCVRACGELVGNFTLGMHERGAGTMLVADYDVPMGQSSCISCGTCVQACPTGALIDRASAYHGLDQKVEKTASTCVACSVGCGVDLMTRDNWLLRVDGNWEAPANDGLLCKAGRYEALEDKRERLVTPLVRKNGALKAATWEEALEAIAAKVKPLAGDGVAALASPRLPAEALYAFRQIFADKLGSRMVTSLEENATLAGPGAVAAEMGGPFEAKLADLKKADCVVLVGTDLREDHQVAGFFIKRALPMGTQLVTLSADQFSELAHFALKPKAGTDGDVLLGLAAAVANQGLAKGPAADELAKVSLKAIGAKTTVTVETLEAVAKVIGAAQHLVFVYGKGLTAQGVGVFRNLATLARLTGAGLLGIQGEANSLAAFAYGLDKAFDAKDCQAVYVALGDGAVSQKLLASLEKVPFKAVQASYVSPATAMADVVLPVEMWAEQEGHYLSLEGRLQATRRGVKPSDEVRSNAAALEALAQKMGLALGADWKAGLQQRVLTTTILE